MIQINPLQRYIDGGARAAITTPPSASLVFDLPGKAIWVKGVKLKGTDHTYTFSHDNYISLTNTPGSNESEDIKIGINTTLLKQAIDTTYGIVNATTNGLAPMFSSANKATAAAATTYNFLGIAGTTLKWYSLPWRNVRINAETSDKLGVNDTDPLIISQGTGISVTWDSSGKKIVITNTAPDQNHNTDSNVAQTRTVQNKNYPLILKGSADDTGIIAGVNFNESITYNPSTLRLLINSQRVVTVADVYVGATASAAATSGLVPAATSALRTYFLRGDGTWATPQDYNTWRPIKVNSSEKLGSGTNTGAVDFVAGTGITLGWDATNKKITITNSAPDQNHNTDRTGIKLGNVSGNKKADGTVILANSASGLIIAGGTNKFSIGDGTNYIEIPITISHGLSTKNITINGTAYAIYTSASSLPTFVAPGSYAGTGGYILATNSAKNGLEWVAKPTSNVTTSAVIASSATGTTQITAAQANPFYNLLEGGVVSRSILFVSGTGITISAAADGKITITNSKPDVNHNTHYTTSMYIGENNNTKANKVVTSPYLKLFDDNTRRSTLRFVSGTGISIASDANGNITITNNSPSVNHNVTTSAVVAASATGTSQITAALTNPYYNLLEGGAVTRSIRFVAGNGITISAATDGLITITNSKPDVNHDTHYTTTMYIGESNDTKSNVVATNPYLKLFDNNTRRSTLRFVAGNGITIGSDASGNITITNSKPDVNHDTHYTTTMFAGENNDTKANKVATNPYLKLFDNNARRSTLRFVAGTGITIASDANGNITVTNASPDVNHNTDRTGVKLGTVSGTQKADSTLIIANSGTGLVFQGGTNLFKIGDGTNYIQVPVTPSFTVTDKSANILTSLTTLATIAGTDIKAKVTVVDSSPTLTTSLQTIATIAGVKIKAKITNYNTDENVKQSNNDNNQDSPILLKNGTGTGNITSGTIFADGVTVNPSTNSLKISGSASSILAIRGHRLGYRHLDAGPKSSWSDSRLYIGYNGFNDDDGVTDSIGFYRSTGTGTYTRTLWAEINSNGLYANTRFGVNGQNTGYNFYVNGTSFLNNTVRIQYNTPNLYIRNTVDTSYSIIRLGTNSNENASYIFQNGPSRTDDGGANTMTIRNNVGVLRLQNRIHIDSTGRVYPEGTNSRRAGMYGVYDSYRIGHIWSMGTAYMIPDNGANFGNLYGLAYKHTNNSTGGAMGGGHQMVWCANGTPFAAMGEAGIWSRQWLHVNGVNSGTDNGITLYNREACYGIMFRQTSNLGTHGYVSGDWATYFTMSDSNNRGWVFRRWGNKNVASISTDGNAYFNGHIRALSSASSWIDGQRYNYGGYNLLDATDTGSYWPWMRQTNKGSSKWFSMGVLNNSLYIIGSTTSRTANSYDYGWRFDVSNGWAYGNFLNSDTLDGIHANGLLTAASLGASGNSTTLSVTVGGTTKTGSVTVPYASSAGSANSVSWTNVTSGTNNKTLYLDFPSFVFRDKSGNWVLGKSDNNTGTLSLGSTAIAQDVELNSSGGNVTLKGAGNVGIGTRSPIQKLDVNGNIILGNSTGETHIYARTSNFSNPALSFYDDTSGYGTMTVLGGGGCTVVGAGESAHEFAPNVRDENLYLTADANVNIFTNLDGGYGSRRHVAQFNTNGDTYLYGNLYLGANASNNFIAFYGNTGDAPGYYQTSFIGEHLWGGSESTELLLMKFNDVGNGTDGTTAYGAGPDRIRHLAHAHVFQIMTSTAQGSFATMAASTAVETKLDISRYRINAYVPLHITGNTNTNMGYTTSNPRIIFSENGSQAVGLVYTDYDDYRSSKGLKVMDVDNNDTSNVWLEVQGYTYSAGFVKNGSSDSYVLLGGGGHKAISDFWHKDNSTVLVELHIDARGLNENTYYPVTISLVWGRSHIECYNHLSGHSKPSWSTHSNGFSVNVAWDTNPSGWGTIGVMRNIHTSAYAWSNVYPVGSIGQLTSSSYEYIYVRGGGFYYFRLTSGCSVTLHTSSYEIYGLTLAPVSSVSWPVAEWGQSFYAPHFYESSDARLKHDISPISQSIRKFRFNDDNKLYYGFIAQELEKSNPELVDTSGGHWTVNYNSAICLVISKLENRVKELEDKLNKYEEIQNI